MHFSSVHDNIKQNMQTYSPPGCRSDICEQQLWHDTSEPESKKQQPCKQYRATRSTAGKMRGGGAGPYFKLDCDA